METKGATMKTKWKMPDWMRPYAEHVTNTGSNQLDRVAVVEEMYNGDADPRVNLPLSTLQACVKSQVALLYRLKEAHGLDERGIMENRYGMALSEIAMSVRVVLASKQLPKKMRPGLQAIDDRIAKAVRP